MGYSPWGSEELDMTELLTFSPASRVEHGELGRRLVSPGAPV